MKRPSNVPSYLSQRELARNSIGINDVYLKTTGLGFNFHKTLRAHYGCVNALKFSKDGQFLASGGDDTRVLVECNLTKDMAVP